MKVDAKRIAIIGVNASGKSVFARQLAERTGLPLFHMDNLFWKGSWEAVPEEGYLAEEKKLVERAIESAKPQNLIRVSSPQALLMLLQAGSSL